MIPKNKSDRCGCSDRPQEKRSSSNFTSADTARLNQGWQGDLPESGSQFDRTEASFSVMPSQYKLLSSKSLVIYLIAKFHEISARNFQKAFELWLEFNKEGCEG
jgi:hypothetical protein